MNKLQNTTVFNRSMYRDFALFTLAAIGVGLAASLTLATIIVLSAPSRDTTIRNVPISELPRPPKTQITQVIKMEAAPASI